MILMTPTLATLIELTVVALQSPNRTKNGEQRVVQVASERQWWPPKPGHPESSRPHPPSMETSGNKPIHLCHRNIKTLANVPTQKP